MEGGERKGEEWWAKVDERGISLGGRKGVRGGKRGEEVGGVIR